MNLIFIGPPGAGKGTQAKILSDKLNIPHISTGDILRSNIREGSDLGRSAEGYVKAGELVPDDLIVTMIKKVLDSDDGRGFILDGFPRNLEQKMSLDKMLSDINKPIDNVVVIDVPKVNLVDRLLQRAVKEGRSDDTKEVIENRLTVYEESTKPIINAYGDMVKIVNGVGTIEEISNRISDSIKQ